jgi:hypothetical protein
MHVLEVVVEDLAEHPGVGIHVGLESGGLGGLERRDARVILREGDAARHCRGSK